jgi:hypothetical protein
VTTKVRERPSLRIQAAEKFDMNFISRSFASWRLGYSIRLKSETVLQLWKT